MGATLSGDPPRTQFIFSRLLRRGDLVATADGAFIAVTHVMRADEISLVSLEFDDGHMWMGDGDAPFAVAADADEAIEWNRRRRELEMRDRSRDRRLKAV
jgi:hypothetical protein